MRNEIEDGFGCAGLVPTKAEASAEDAFKREREAYERLEKHVKELQNEIQQLHRELTFRDAAIRCAFQNLEGNVNNPIPSLMAVRAAVQALRAYAH